MVESIEILAETVHSIIAVEDSIRVEHRNDHEVELISELGGLRVVADQKINQAIHCITGSDFSRMHPRRYQDQRLMNFSKMFLTSIRKEMFNVFLRRIFEGITAGDGHKMDGSFLINQLLLYGERTSTSLLKYVSSLNLNLFSNLSRYCSLSVKDQG